MKYSGKAEEFRSEKTEDEKMENRKTENKKAESKKTENRKASGADQVFHLDDMLKRALKPADAPAPQVNKKIIEQAGRNRFGFYEKRGVPAFAVILCCTLLLGSISAAAAVHFLAPREIAYDLEDIRLSDTLGKENDLDGYKCQIVGDFKVTFLGLMSGEDISDSLLEDNSIGSATYAVIAVENADGKPMAERLSDWKYSCCQMFLVEGYGLSHCIANAGSGYSKDGIIYYIFEADNVEIFADRTVYLAVYGEKLNEEVQSVKKTYVEPYLYDEKTGKISRNADYEGINALFEVPLDPEKADPEAAEKYMQNY